MGRQAAGGAAAKVARPGPAPADVVRGFTRGTEWPRGVTWFGFRSFWGHLRHFIAAAVATENIDCRDWMSPDDPRELLARILGQLGGDPGAASLTDGLGRDVYVDFVADTGDDTAVSRAVARLIFAAYELPDPDRPGEVLTAPRGDILCFGGDTAYPVATAKELTNRVIAPWNEVLRALENTGRPRVLLGLAGNHDWYDGLDGFARMFRRRPPGEEAEPIVAAIGQLAIEHQAEWAKELLLGGTVDKPKALALFGYTPVQSATYFALSVTPGVELVAVDRQLKAVDSRQAWFLGEHQRAHPESATLVLLPDPVYPFGAESPVAAKVVETLGFDLEEGDNFVLSGDIHHYERLEKGRLLHVIAGGGGAFLHPARIAKGGLPRTTVWPGVPQCRMLLRGAAWKLALGRSGLIPHFLLAALFAPIVLLASLPQPRPGLIAAAAVLDVLVIGAIYALLGGATRTKAVHPVALGAALLTTAMPFASLPLARWVLLDVARLSSVAVVACAALIVAAAAGAFIFGVYLVVLTLLGYENLHAFTVLDHPGFKHFVRLRLRADGRGVDGWCVGLVDPLGADGKPVLVDQFAWRPKLKI